jgi:ABC-type transporter Mla subunit MlaD
MADLNQYIDDPAIGQARDAYQGAASNVASMSGQVNQLPYKLRDAINKKLDNNRDLIEQKNKAKEDYFSSAAEGREQYQDIFNPFQREALVTRGRNQAYTPYANLQDILATRQGGIQNMIGAASTAAQGDLNTATNQATLLQQQYTDLLNEASMRSDNAYRQASLNNSGSSGGGLDLGGILTALTGGEESGGEEYQSPPYTPGRAGMEVEYPPGSGVVWESDAQGGWL